MSINSRYACLLCYRLHQDQPCLQPPVAASTSAPSTPELTTAREASTSTSAPASPTSAPSSPPQPPPPTTAGASILPTPATASNFTVPPGYAPLVAFTATFTAIPSKSLTPGQAGPPCQYAPHSPAIAALWVVLCYCLAPFCDPGHAGGAASMCGGMSELHRKLALLATLHTPFSACRASCVPLLTTGCQHCTASGNL